MSSIELIFSQDKETKNAVRFSEVVAEGRERAVAGSIYVLKTDLASIGSPKSINVTIKAG